MVQESKKAMKRKRDVTKKAENTVKYHQLVTQRRETLGEIL